MIAEDDDTVEQVMDDARPEPPEVDSETTSPPPPPPPSGGPPPPKRLVRSSDRRIAGVAGGIAEYFAIDPVIVRLAFVVGVFIGGTGLIAYAIAWAVLPDADQGPRPQRGPLDPTTVLALVALGLAAWIGIAEPFDGGIVVPVLLVGAGIYLLTQRPDVVDSLKGANHQLPQREPVPNVPPPMGPPATSSGVYTPGGPSGTGTAQPLRVPPRPLREPSIITTVTLSALALLTAGAIAVDTAGWIDTSATTVISIGLVIVGVAAIAGAFVGRARGMILIGTLLTLGLGVANVIEPVFDDGVGERRYQPATLADIEPTYELGIGELVVDLSAVEIPADEVVRVEVDLGIGEARVLVPPDVDLEITGDLDVGDLEVLDRRTSGIGNDLEVQEDNAGSATLIIDLEVGIGHGVVEHG